ncbi:MAG TPA: hypothetical protein VNI52_13755 [Sphingobacteriaceae bacterium]|nr:hypothetical protein [Sphingobacteriaceae bacterium]
MDKYIVTCLFFGFVSPVFGQDKSVNDLYLDFSVERTEGSPLTALSIGEKILSHSEKLPAGNKDNFNYHMGKLYEVNHEDEKSILFYEKVVAAVPDYYVPHLALGNLYLKLARPLIPKINASKGNKAKYDNYLYQYQKILLKVIPHFEKAQACDPNDQTLKTLKYLYQSLKTPEKYTTLNTRLETLSVNCITLLTD